ncbi:MAG: tetratricopeptide repeat protein [Candidatus Aquicultor sp.]
MNVYARLFFRAIILALMIGIVVVLGLLAKTAVVRNAPAVPRTYVERAYVDAEEAVKGDPRNAKARVALAKADIAVGRFNNAIEQASVATRLDRKSMDAYMTLGIAYNRTNQHDAAISTLKKALQVEQGTAELQIQVYDNLGQAYEATGNIPDAVSSYGAAYDSSGQDINIGYSYARMLEKAGKPQEALIIYKDIVAFVPDEKKAQDELVRLTTELQASKKGPAAKATTAPSTKAKQ